MSALARRLRDQDDGFTAGAEALLFGVLIFVAGLLIAVNSWGVIDAKFAATAAAREATRAAVEAPPGADVLALAQAAAEQAVLGHGKDLARLDPVRAFGALDQQRCGHIAFEATYHVPATILPFLGAFNHGKGFTVTGRHAEIIDPYRSGLAVPDPAQRPEDVCDF